MVKQDHRGANYVFWRMQHLPPDRRPWFETNSSLLWGIFFIVWLCWPASLSNLDQESHPISIHASWLLQTVMALGMKVHFPQREWCLNQMMTNIRAIYWVRPSFITSNNVPAVIDNLITSARYTQAVTRLTCVPQEHTQPFRHRLCQHISTPATPWPQNHRCPTTLSTATPGKSCSQ